MALPISSANTIKIVTKSGFLTGSAADGKRRFGTIRRGVPGNPFGGESRCRRRYFLRARERCRALSACACLRKTPAGRVK
jgi:hypothetical protein